MSRAKCCGGRDLRRHGRLVTSRPTVEHRLLDLLGAQLERRNVLAQRRI
jgi:hypothetical protein